MKIERSSQGLIDLSFNLLDKVHNEPTIEFKDRIKMHSTLMKDIRSTVQLELEHKRMLLRAPELTANRKYAIDFRGEK